MNWSKWVVSGSPDSRDVSAIRVLAARESRHEECTTSLPHLIMGDDMTVVLSSAKRRLPDVANRALRFWVRQSHGELTTTNLICRIRRNRVGGDRFRRDRHSLAFG